MEKRKSFLFRKPDLSTQEIISIFCIRPPETGDFVTVQSGAWGVTTQESSLKTRSYRGPFISPGVGIFFISLPYSATKNSHFRAYLYGQGQAEV